MKNIQVGFLILLLLFGCNTNEKVNDDYEEQLESEEQKFVIQTVEPSTKNVVTNVGVTLIEKETNEIIGKEIVDDNGKVEFSGLKQNAVYEVTIHQILPTGQWHELKKKEFVFDKSKSYITIETFNLNKKILLDVPVVLQNPELPNGCEVTSLTAVLNYYGVNVNKMEMAKRMPSQPIVRKGKVLYGPDPNEVYAGDPRNRYYGFFVFPPPVVETANKVLMEHHLDLRAMDMTKMDKNDFIDLIQQGVPVIAWVTLDFTEVYTNGYWINQDTSEKHPFYGNLHVVVVTGYQNGKVFIMNPLKGNEVIDEEKFFNSFQSIGSKAVVIL